MSPFQLRTMTETDRSEVSELIHVSTNYWYEANRNMKIFVCRPDQVDLFCRVYGDLDPGCCVVAEYSSTGRIIGSCFYHPRSTHISLGIMNTHPSYFGLGVARAMLKFICELADLERKPLRLVSSAMNLDSYSLYNRAGFVPYATFQDMLLTVPADGLAVTVPRMNHVRDATRNDLPGIVELERDQLGIERENDLRYFLENRDGIWNVSVLVESDGTLSGYLASVNDPASNMIGPGVSKTEDDAAALILFELNRYPGQTPVWLIPTSCNALARTLYEWGAKNCELHFGQIRGGRTEFTGVMMPTFMPETA